MPPSPVKPPSLKQTSRPIHRLLGKLRARIRRYVCLEGIAWSAIWLVLTFWAAFAMDYLPVWLGASELSKSARIVVLVLIGMLVAWVIYRLVLRRVFVRMKDSSMALLIEQKYPVFNDSLLTTVNQRLSQPSDVAVDSAMLDRTRMDAEKLVDSVDLSKVLNGWPLKRSLILASLLLLSLIGFAVASPSAIKTAGQRIYLLDAKPWPRVCQIEMVGIKVKRENPVEGIEELGQTLLPIDNVFRIAKGSTLTLMVRAESDENEQQRRLPNSCSLIYRTEEGSRGTQVFKKIGVPRDGFQLYSISGQPLQGILGDLSFDVRGGDHRLGPFKIEVVDEPSVFDTKLACEFPPYIVDEQSLRWTNRTIDWSGQLSLPQGTKVSVIAKSNKGLKKVYAIESDKQSVSVIEPHQHSFEFKIPSLDERASVQFYLCDDDGIVSEIPHSVVIEPIEDQTPVVETRLTGIGTAVTPDVQVPFSGTVADDYGLQRTWIEIEVAETEVLTEDVAPNVDGDLETVLDFKQRRQDLGEQYKLPVGEESTVAFVIKAEDRFNLSGNPNQGFGDRYVLDVVSPNELVRILERSEVGERRRLEQIYLELVDARNYLVRSKSNLGTMRSEIVEPSSDLDLEPGEDEDVEGDEPRKQELRLLFSQRAILQVDKSSHEILGCAEAFDNIRLQLINNRIDSEDRKTRFSEQIIAPLRLIGGGSMQQLREKITLLETGLRDLQVSPNDLSVSEAADELAFESMESIDVVLKQLDKVLSVLIKYETQNELLDIVRKMIKNQEELMNRTKKERQKKAFEGLLDLN